MKILVLGAGIIGATLSLELAENGHQVMLVDRRALGAGASGSGTGLLVHRDARIFHSTFREIYVRSIREYYPQFIRDLQKYNPRVRLEGGGFTLFYSDALKWNKAQEQFIREGAENYEMLTRENLQRHGLGFPQFPDEKAFYFPDEKWVHNGELLKALQLKMQTLGVRGIWPTEETPSREGKGWAFNNEKFDLLCVTSGVWSTEVLTSLGYPLPLVPVKGQVVLLAQEAFFRGVYQVDDSFYLVPRRLHKKSTLCVLDGTRLE